MIDIYRQTDLVDHAVQRRRTHRLGVHPTQRAELDAIEARLADLDTRTGNRLLTAIENGLAEEDAVSPA
jgi:hypothetical protein